MRRSKQILNASLKKQIQKTFFQTITDLKSIDEVETFLKDFLTEAELEVFSKRLAVSYWLKKGRSYTNIKRNLKVSSATIADSVTNLKKKGIELGLKKIEAEEWANKWSGKIHKLIN